MSHSRGRKRVGSGWAAIAGSFGGSPSSVLDCPVELRYVNLDSLRQFTKLTMHWKHEQRRPEFFQKVTSRHNIAGAVGSSAVVKAHISLFECLTI